MARRTALAALVALPLSVALAACSGGGTHTQSYSPSPPSSPSSASASITDPATSSTSSSSPAPIPTPTVTPPAQLAAAAYIGFQNALYAALNDPKHADLAAMNRYLSPSAQQTYDALIHQQAASGRVWRGAPPTPRLKIITSSATAVFMTSCPLVSTSDPGREYDAATGNPLPVSTPAVPPPYLETLTISKVGGHWTLTMENQNRGKTCTA